MGAFARGAEIGRRVRQDREELEASETRNDLRQFCRDLQAQDIAELDRMMPFESEAEIQEYERLLGIYSARSNRCFALAG